jgi:hypothetical protein
MDMDMDYFAQRVSVCKQEPATLMRWLAGQGVAHLVEAVRLQLDLLAKERAGQVKPEHLAELAASCLVRSIDMLHSTDEKLHSKTPIDPELERRVNQIRVTSTRYKPPKRAQKKQELVVRYEQTIRQLRDQGLSWKNVSRYLLKYHHYRVSVGYIQRIFVDVKKGGGNG